MSVDASYMLKFFTLVALMNNLTQSYCVFVPFGPISNVLANIVCIQYISMRMCPSYVVALFWYLCHDLTCGLGFMCV